ncbi:MAG TPA: YhdT family protein [Thermoanaerobacterales bacterium]|nr:YhdT family protein [Thermoanaerobacterales bacterium]
MQKENKSFIEDPRYKQCNKEALLGLGLGILNLIWWFVWGYGLGSKPPEEYTYVLGFPLWFFMSCVVGAILFTILAIVIVTKYFKDMPLGTLTKEEADRIKEMM